MSESKKHTKEDAIRTLQKQAWDRAMKDNYKPNAGTPHDWEDYWIQVAMEDKKKDEETD